MPFELPGSAPRKRQFAGDAFREALQVLVNGTGPGGHGNYQGWRELAPDDRRLEHGGEAGMALGLVEGLVGGQGLRAGDETGSVGIGPMGLAVNKAGENGWSASIGPDGASFSKGDLSVSGGWGQGWSGEIGLGPVRVGGGYGMAPVQAPVGYELPGAISKPGYWGQVSVQLGGGRQQRQLPPAAVEQTEPEPSPARREMDQQLRLYRQSNSDWWRPN